MVNFYHKIEAMFTFTLLPPIDLCLYYIEMHCSINAIENQHTERWKKYHLKIH